MAAAVIVSQPKQSFVWDTIANLLGVEWSSSSLEISHRLGTGKSSHRILDDLVCNRS